uniref:Uncharacterized protein n=1 Tax=Equus asinus asinus TaxID=83772 RepID=A0A8C4M8F2_EQUAS
MCYNPGNDLSVLRFWIAALERNFLKSPVIRWTYSTNFLNADPGFTNRKCTQKRPVLCRLESDRNLGNRIKMPLPS